jgi:hypothetical protein
LPGAPAKLAPVQPAPPSFDDQDLAQWLREAGRRRRPSARAAPGGEPAPALPGQRAGMKNRYLLHALAGLGALAYLELYFTNVMLQIYSLPRVMVFIMVDGLPPPV